MSRCTQFVRLVAGGTLFFLLVLAISSAQELSIHVPGVSTPSQPKLVYVNGRGPVQYAVPQTSTLDTYYGSSQTIWSGSAVPANNYPPYIPAEMGVKFYVAQAGQIQGIRFYKDSQNTGTHVGHLWDSSGDLLASVTFTNESDSGWQMAMFASPVTVQNNQLYVASYYSPTGAFSADLDYFNNPYTSGAISLPSSSVAAGNGVYTFGPEGSFPDQSYEATNYWVDIVYAAQQSSSSPLLSIWSDSAVPANNYGAYIPSEMGEQFQVNEGGQIEGIRFYKGPQNTGTHVGHLWDSSGNLLASVTFTNETPSGWQSADFSQAVTVQPYVTYTVSYYSPTGAFSVDLNYLNNPYTSGSITLLSSVQSGGNGVYSFAGSGSFPSQTYDAPNYWVDILFAPGGSSGCVPQSTYPNTATYPTPAPACPPPLPPNPNPPGSNSQDFGPIHPCMVIQNGVRYQGIIYYGTGGPETVLNSTLYLGTTCDPSAFVDQIFFGETYPFYYGGTAWYIHFWDEPNTSAYWTVGNINTPCINYSLVPDCD